MPKKVERIEITCPVCKLVFRERESRGRIYCSRDCGGKATAAKYEAARTVRTCEACGKRYKVRPALAESRFCSIRCKNPHQSRATAEKRGNTLRYRGQGKTYVKLNGRHLHRVKAEAKIGRKLVLGEVVHHADHDKRNNEPENLIVLPSQAEHARIHGWKRK